MTDIPEGAGFVAGRRRATAARLLELADEVGVNPREVRAVSDGYIVPLAVLDAYEGGPTDTEVEADLNAAEANTPTSDWKNAEIKTWAEANGVDLGAATTKADMLAAIAAANKED